MDFADDENFHEIIAKTKANGGGLKTMIRELVANELFARP
jgi:hypothetical protein